MRIYVDEAAQDYLYLSPIIKEIEAEKKEREDLDVMTLKKSK
jgi:hypothetical protein